MLEMRQLEALRAVAQTGSIARAAEHLGWSQPTVDYHLKKVDRVAGAPVLRRSTQGSSLTSVGALLLERAHEILALSERAVSDTRNLAAVGRVRLRFGTFSTGAALLLPSIVARLGSLGIEVDATLQETSELVTRVNRRELDAALLYSVPGYSLPFRSDVVVAEVFRDPLLLAMPQGHRLAGRENIDRAELLGLARDRWNLGATRGDPMDSVLLDAFGADAENLDIAVRTDDCAVMLGTVAAGMAVGLVPRMAVGSVHPGVVARPLEDPSFARSILLAYPEEEGGRARGGAVRELANAVRESIKELDPGNAASRSAETAL